MDPKPKAIHRNQVRLERYKTKNVCTIRSLGAPHSHSFHTKNISESGLLIVGAGAKYEFNKSTMLEVCLSGTEQINFLTKVMRVNNNEFGLKIIQADRLEMEKYIQLINLLSKQLEEETKLQNVS
jgi:hypothetical protein